MKNSYLLLVLLVSLWACQIDPKIEQEAAEQTVANFYDALTQFDFDKARQFVAADFYAVDDETFMASCDKFFDFVRPMEGAKINFNFNVENAKVDGNHALVTYAIKGTVDMEGNSFPIDALETHYLTKNDGKWLIEAFHCTYKKNKLEGTWELESCLMQTGDGGVFDFHKEAPDGKELVVYGSGHWSAVTTAPSIKVFSGNVGTYTFVGNVLTETVTFSNEGDKVGSSSTFEITFDGDNKFRKKSDVYDEVWVKVD